MQHKGEVITTWATNQRSHAKKLLILALFLLVSTTVLTLLAPTPRAYAQTSPPNKTSSLYADSIDAQKHYDFGCAQGQRSTQNGPGFGVLILFFGRQTIRNGVSGTLLPGSDRFASNQQIRHAVVEYARGFYLCTPFYGPRLRIVVGTSNSQQSTSNGMNPTSAGYAWADLVNLLADDVRTAGYGVQIDVAGGNDLETDFSQKNWVFGWVAAYQTRAYHVYYDFGDAAGCYAGIGPLRDTCNNGWRQEDVWYKSRGAAMARSIPQIYFTRNNLQPKVALQWQRVSLYGYVMHDGANIIFGGSLTQRLACEDRNWREVRCWHNAVVNGGERTNTPGEGWQQFYNQLNSDTRTRQNLGWSTDISWRLHD